MTAPPAATPPSSSTPGRSTPSPGMAAPCTLTSQLEPHTPSDFPDSTYPVAAHLGLGGSEQNSSGGRGDGATQHGLSSSTDERRTCKSRHLAASWTEHAQLALSQGGKEEHSSGTGIKCFDLVPA
jgi:hypothetical protein